LENNKFNNQGFTLIETVIAVAIVGLVIAMSFSLLAFGQNYFSMSNTQYGIQNDGRITSSYLSKELRFATEIEIIDVFEARDEIIDNESIDEPYNFLYIKDGKLHNYIYQSGSYKQISFGNSISNSNSKFQKVNDEVLRIVIESTEDDKNYDLNTEINLENLKLNDNNINGNEGLAIKYKTEYIETSEDESEDEDSPTINIGTQNGVLKAGESGTISFNITTSNIANGESLSISINSGEYYFSFPSQITVMNNSSSLTINSNETVVSDNYVFNVEYGSVVKNDVFTVIDEEVEPLQINNPNNITIAKNSTYTFTPNISGGVEPYNISYVISLIEGGTYTEEGNNLIWDSPNGNKKKFIFDITVIDSGSDMEPKNVTIITN